MAKVPNAYIKLVKRKVALCYYNSFNGYFDSCVLAVKTIINLGVVIDMHFMERISPKTW